MRSIACYVTVRIALLCRLVSNSISLARKARLKGCYAFIEAVLREGGNDMGKRAREGYIH